MNITEYIQKYGIMQNWFARELGIHPTLLSLVLRGKRPFPKKYWKDAIALSHNIITIEALYEQSVAYAREHGPHKKNPEC